MFGLPGVGQRNHVPVNQRINNYLRDIRVLIPVMGLISTLCVEFQRSTGMITNQEANINRGKNIETKALVFIRTECMRQRILEFEQKTTQIVCQNLFESWYRSCFNEIKEELVSYFKNDLKDIIIRIKNLVDC